MSGQKLIGPPRRDRNGTKESIRGIMKNLNGAQLDPNVGMSSSPVSSARGGGSRSANPMGPQRW